MELRAYSLVGVRPEADFMLWKLTERYDDLRELGTALNGDAARRLADDAVLLPRGQRAVAVLRAEEQAARAASSRAARPTSSSTRS